MPVKNYTSHYDSLKDKWSETNRKLQKAIWEDHHEAFHYLNTKLKHSSLSAVGAFLLLTTPMVSTSSAQNNTSQAQEIKIPKKYFYVSDFSKILPQSVGPLSSLEENQVLLEINRDYGIDAKAEMEGIRLAQNYGYIGQEQHLARYPGDNMSTHFDNSTDAETFSSYGMAPGLGAYGYFGTSSNLTQEQIDEEKYYVAIQTFLAPGYNENSARYNDFFKFKKMIIINPQNGKAVIGVIGDAGPAPWTGKQLGGSPELMNYLERVDGAEKGPVLYFFLNDPQNKVPLGPIQGS